MGAHNHWLGSRRPGTGTPNATTQQDVDRLRQAGLSDAEIFATTVYVALRIAFSTVNDGIGARPDSELVAEAPSELVAAIDFGRTPEPIPSQM